MSRGLLLGVVIVPGVKVLGVIVCAPITAYMLVLCSFKGVIITEYTRHEHCDKLDTASSAAIFPVLFALIEITLVNIRSMSYVHFRNFNYQSHFYVSGKLSRTQKTTRVYYTLSNECINASLARPCATICKPSRVKFVKEHAASEIVSPENSRKRVRIIFGLKQTL